MLPSEVTICGITYLVRLCEDSFDADAMHFGQIDYGAAVISINEEISYDLKKQTLFHEMLHGMLVLIGRPEEAHDEQLVQALSNAMYQSFELKEERHET